MLLSYEAVLLIDSFVPAFDQVQHLFFYACILNSRMVVSIPGMVVSIPGELLSCNLYTLIKTAHFTLSVQHQSASIP